MLHFLWDQHCRAALLYKAKFQELLIGNARQKVWKTLIYCTSHPLRREDGDIQFTHPLNPPYPQTHRRSSPSPTHRPLKGLVRIYTLLIPSQHVVLNQITAPFPLPPPSLERRGLGYTVYSWLRSGFRGRLLITK